MLEGMSPATIEQVLPPADLDDVVSTASASRAVRRAGADESRADLGGSVVRTALLRSALVGLLALALIATPTVLGMRWIARQHALEVQELRALALAVRTVAPLVDRAVLDGEPRALERLDAVVRARISDGSIVRIKVWDADGRVVYSDATDLVGRRFDLEPSVVDLLSSGGATAVVERVESAENLFEPRGTQLVEVYAAATAPTGDPVLVEAYFPMDGVHQLEGDLLMRILPLGLGALGLLVLIQLPMAASLARRVEREHAASRRLLQQAVAASDLERRRIARDLHDDVIQDLSGVAYALESTASRVDDSTRPLIGRTCDIVQRDVRTLREMLAELYPADVDSLGLAGAVTLLAEPLRAHGTTVRIDVPDVEVDGTSALLLYRVAREALTNVAKHADADEVDVTLTDRGDAVVLSVRDDGRGFAGDGWSGRGHLGLRLVQDTVAEAGGSVRISSREGVGTCVTVSLPKG